MGRKTQKFLFDQNIFDEPEQEEEVIEAPPPPPVFSEEELETVRHTTYEKAYACGKQDGITQETSSREQTIAHILQTIADEATLLFSAEHERDRLFEKEVISTTLAIFEKLFPLYSKSKGSEEMANAIGNVLRKQEDQSIITIDVHPDMVESIQEHISKVNLRAYSEKRFEVLGKEDLSLQSCRMYWKDGGAARNIEALADEIRDILKDTLAGTHTNGHDRVISADHTLSAHPENPDYPADEQDEQ